MDTQQASLDGETAAVRHQYERGARFYDIQVWPMELSDILKLIVARQAA